MNRNITTHLLLVVVLMATTLFAADDPSPPDYVHSDSATKNTHYGCPIMGSAKTDTFIVYGGPGSQEGKFEDAFGNPSWDDGTKGMWIGIDNTQDVESIWNISTYNAANIGGGGLGNHAWWCGEMWEACDPEDDPEGYGNNIRAILEWTGAVVDNSMDVTIQIDLELEYDSEPGYDGTTLQYRDAAGMQVLYYWDGEDTVGQDPACSFTFGLSPADYGGIGGDEVMLRFEFVSDSAWSDEDCDWPTTGAVQIDDIAIWFEQDGGGQVLQGTVEDCEGKSPAQWYTAIAAGVGDFAQLWPALSDQDPFGDNSSVVVAFIDDGIVVPGTGGTSCITWCYGPFGYTINSTGGLAGPDFHLNNHVESPAIEWDPLGTHPPGTDGARLAFDVYSHTDLSFPGYDGSFYTWGIASSTDGGITFGDWQNDGFNNIGGPVWDHRDLDCTGYLAPGKTHVKIKLGVWERGYIWGYEGTDSSPAPYFDNVSLKAYAYLGPAISAREIDMFQDNFPAIGVVDTTDLHQNSIRVDMARNISPAEHLRNDPGDSMIVDVAAVRAGATLHWNPRMYYEFKTNPLFDLYRDPGFVPSGYVEGDTVRNAGGIIVDDKWAFDLPDEGWLYPGDCFHWYIEAQDDVAGDIGVSLLPADTSGFHDFSNAMAYNSSFIVRGLPSLRSDDGKGIEYPQILLWNDYANRGTEDEWCIAMDNLGLAEGRDYDIYYTNGPTSGVGNGLGGRATELQLDFYSTMLYDAGDLHTFTITPLDYLTDPGDDIGVVDAWLRLGQKNMLLTGDNLLSDLVDTSPEGEAFAATWISADRVYSDVSPYIDLQVAPTVLAIVDNPIFTIGDTWIAYGGYPTFKTFDAAVALPPAEAIAEFADPNGTAGVYPYAATVCNELPFDAAKVVYMPYGFGAIYSPSLKEDAQPAARTMLLWDVLVYFGHMTASPATSHPDLTQSTATMASVPEVSLFVVPDVSGDPLSNARLQGGGTADATITLVLRDGAGFPIPGYPKQDMWLESTLGGVTLCPAGSIADRDTDANGMTTFSGPICGGGYTDYGAGEKMMIVINGEALTGPPLNLRVNSADMNGDLDVDLGDIWLFSWDYLGGPYNYRSDFQWDATLNLSDIVCLAQSIGIRNNASPLIETDGTAATIVFDDGMGGYTPCLPAATGVIRAYLRLIHCTEAQIGAFEIKVKASGSPVVLATTLSTPNIDFGAGVLDDTGQQFLVAYGPSPVEVTDSAVILVTWDLFVLAGQAIEFYIEPAVPSSYPTDPVPVYLGEEMNVFHEMAHPRLSYDLPVAFINTDCHSAVEDPPEAPVAFSLQPNFPNPFNPRTTIRYGLPIQSRVSLRIFDISGRLVRTLVDNEILDPGYHDTVWNGQNDAGRQVAAGMYFFDLEAGEFRKTGRMTLVK